MKSLFAKYRSIQMCHDMQLLSVDDSVGKSRHILGSMNQRMSQHKWIIVTVIAVLVLAIALIVYVKMHSKRS